MPLAKPAAPQPKQEQIPAQAYSAEVNAMPTEWSGVPMDLYHYFSVPIGGASKDEAKKLKDIYGWAKRGTTELGEVMQRVSHLERRMGIPSIGERRYDKMWRYVIMDRQVSDMEKRRDALIGR